MKLTTSKSMLITVSLLLMVSLISGCSKSSTSNKVNGVASTSKLDTIYFPKNEIVSVDISIDETAFQEILDDPTAEAYHSANVTYNGKKFDNVGFRTKGNSSLTSVAKMTDSERYSFKLSLDEYVTQNIEGVTTINLNNNYSDASYMREFLAYEIAENMSIPTPKHSFVNVYINGELWGLYTAVEQMNSAFIEREFEDSSGTLYKSNGGTGADLTALATFEEYTGLDVKYGEADEEALLHMTDVLNNSDRYEEVLDVSSALKFIALNTVTANLDSYAGNFKHNYYLYETDGIFSIIPWDMNMAFGGFGGSGILIDEPTGVALNTRPLIANLIASDTYREQYHTIINELVDREFTSGQFVTRVQEVQSLISDSVAADPTAFVTYEEYEKGVASLLTFVDTQIESISKQLSGEIESAGDGSGSASGGPGNGGGGKMNFGGRGDNADGAMTPPDGMNFGGQDGNADGAMAPPDGMNFGGQDGNADGAMAPPDGMNFGGEDGNADGAMTPPDGMNFGGGAMDLLNGMSIEEAKTVLESIKDGTANATEFPLPDGISLYDALTMLERITNNENAGGMNFGGQGGNRGPGNMGQFQMGGGLNANPSSVVPTISTEVKLEHALTTLFSVIAILIGASFIVLFRRKRL
ncbi:CotH kinase family protein [Paenibacillus endoradicis]|uniref:CotH kinase family protein n=1 Tax=Paenibacillus endoradicis TaxID=2972487 RepID=UPI00215999F7|nr:CotH kinase family protein [Paenibacillus endoradicis]MCR8655800.1 CotH kinase family protein [Paenibacillus endoradicis]MCR8658126.1 CotH kinase family protein [Paenibacillus endoradicis]